MKRNDLIMIQHGQDEYTINHADEVYETFEPTQRARLRLVDPVAVRMLYNTGCEVPADLFDDDVAWEDSNA